MRLLSLLSIFLTCAAVRAQYIAFITNGEVNAPVTMPDGSPPGPDFQAQLLRVMDDGTLQPLTPTTIFQTDAKDPRLRYFVKPIVLIVPGISFADVFADPIPITVRMRAWQGTDWQTSRWRGESDDIPVLIRSQIFPPASLDGLQGFTLELQPRIGKSLITTDGQFQIGLSSQLTNLQTVVIERSTDLVHWTQFGEFPVDNDQTSFSDSDIHTTDAAFFRVRFQ